MDLILSCLVSFALGVVLSDFIKDQVKKLERKNK